MKSRWTRVIGICLIFMGGWTWVPPATQAGVELSVLEELHLEAPALDVTVSPDGKWLFILTSGEIIVYTMPEHRVVKRMKIDGDFDQITHSDGDNMLILTSRAKNTLKMIRWSVRHHFTVDGLAFRGPEEAPVTIAVFSDYQ